MNFVRLDHLLKKGGKQLCSGRQCPARGATHLALLGLTKLLLLLGLMTVGVGRKVDEFSAFVRRALEVRLLEAMRGGA